jgi:hypothetical protein
MQASTSAMSSDGDARSMIVEPDWPPSKSTIMTMPSSISIIAVRHRREAIERSKHHLNLNLSLVLARNSTDMCITSLCVEGKGVAT